MSTISSRPPGFSTRAASVSASPGDGRWCKHEQHGRRVERRDSIGRRLERATAQLDVRQILRPRCARRRASRRTVDADHAPDVRRERGEQRAGATAEIADVQSAGSRAEQRLQKELARRTARHAADPTRRPRWRKTAATPRCGPPARAQAGARPARRPGVPASCSRMSVQMRAFAAIRPRRARARSSGWSPSRRDDTHPASASVFSCRLTVDCGSCRTAQSSETVSSCRSRSHSIRHRTGSASAESAARIGRSARETAFNP